jgi:hypothetical protein
MKAKLWLMWALLVALNIFDWMATDLIIWLGGREANPIMLAVINRWGTIGILYAKLPVLAVIALLVSKFDKLSSRGQWIMTHGMAICLIAYTFLAIWHVKLIMFATS